MNDRENMREILDRLHKAGAAHGGCNEGEGLHGKYLVYKAKTGERVENAFILRPDKDEAAIAALRAYAVATENKELAEDIFRWVGKGLQKPLTVEELEEHIGKVVHLEYAGNKMEDYPVLLGHCGMFYAEFEMYDAYDSSEFILDDYGKTWRCWAEKPTEEERMAAEWLK